jgi:hypothetical protein
MEIPQVLTRQPRQGFALLIALGEASDCSMEVATAMLVSDRARPYPADDSINATAMRNSGNTRANLVMHKNLVMDKK